MLHLKHITLSLKHTALLLLCCVCSLAVSAQVVVQAHADTASILIGEQIDIKVTCSVNAKQQVQFPYFQPKQELVKGVEVVGNGRVDTLLLNDGKRMELSRRYTITSFDSAVYRIPPFKVTVDGKEYASRGNIGLKVSTVPVDTVHVDQFNGPHDVIDQPFEWSWELILLALLCVVLLVCITAMAVRLADPRLITRRVVINPPVPAHVKAMNSIEQIKKQPTDNVKEYYTNLTEALRTYIEDRFKFNAREMTTAEIIDKLCETNNEAALNELKNVLLTADLVKFAKHSTSLSEQDRNLVQALDYVQTTQLPPEALPKPKIETVSLSNKQQLLWRNVMRVATVVLSVVTLALFAYCIYICYCSFA